MDGVVPYLLAMVLLDLPLSKEGFRILCQMTAFPIFVSASFDVFVFFVYLISTVETLTSSCVSILSKTTKH